VARGPGAGVPTGRISIPPHFPVRSDLRTPAGTQFARRFRQAHCCGLESPRSGGPTRTAVLQVVLKCVSHNISRFRCDIWLLMVGCLAHPETRRDLALKAANYFRKLTHSYLWDAFGCMGDITRFGNGPLLENCELVQRQCSHEQKMLIISFMDSSPYRNLANYGLISAAVGRGKKPGLPHCQQSPRRRGGHRRSGEGAQQSGRGQLESRVCPTG